MELTGTERQLNERLFEKEFMPHLDALYNFAYHLTLNEEDANDLVQDTFLKAFRFINSYERGTNAKAWLFKILKNSFINEYRRKTRQPGEVDFEEYVAFRMPKKVPEWVTWTCGMRYSKDLSVMK